MCKSKATKDQHLHFPTIVYSEPNYKTGAWGAWEEVFNCSLIGEETVTWQVMNYPGLTISYRERSKTLIVIILPTMWCFTFSWLTMSIAKLIFNEFIWTIKRRNYISEYDRWIPAFGKAFSSQRLHLVIISKILHVAFWYVYYIFVLHLLPTSPTPPKWFCKLSSSCYNQGLHNFVEILIVTLIFKVKVKYYFPTFHN